jgi:hypothetical protein
MGSGSLDFNAAGSQGANDIAAAADAYNDQACFVAGTPLLTPGGSKAVEEFQPGDLVLSRDENNPEGPVEAKVVEEVFLRFAPVLELEIGGRTIGTTAEHPFWVRGKGWLPAGGMVVGDLLLGLDGKWVVLTGKRDTGEWASVYNLRVADYHSYFVGEETWGWSVWAHNAKYIAKAVKPVNGRNPINAARAYASGAMTVGGVKFTKAGFPIFTPHAMRQKGKIVQTKITYTGSRNDDFKAANKAFGWTSTPAGYTWHHKEDVTKTRAGNVRGTLVLVETSVHESVKHTGGVAFYTQLTKITYKP